MERCLNNAKPFIKMDNDSGYIHLTWHSNTSAMLLLDDEKDKPKSVDITLLLSRTRVCLANPMSMEEIDIDISAMRNEWARKRDIS